MSAIGSLELAGFHESHGVVVGEDRGFALPLHYGDLPCEIEACSSGCGVVDLSWGDRLELRGADRVRLVNGLFTADVPSLEVDCGVYGFFTDQRGKVLADAYVSALADRLWLELPAGTGAVVKEHIERYRVIDDVEVRALDDMLDVAVLGEQASAVLASMIALPEIDRLARTSLRGTEIHICRRRIHGVEGFVLWLPAAIAEMILEEVVGRDDVHLCGFGALDTVRCRAGVGRWGVDFDAGNVVNETGLLEAAVDFEKGCYLGQEIVARIFYRGRPAKECRALEIEADARPDPGPLTADGEDCGAVTSVAAGMEAAGSAAWAAVGSLTRSALESVGEGGVGWVLGNDQGAVRLRDPAGRLRR